MSETSRRAPGRANATSYDVAKRAGVSQSAVSRSFKPGASIAPATRAKVLAAAAELNYQPNAIAQGLIMRRSNLVAVLISRRTNLYYPEVLAELSQRLSEQDMRVLLFSLQQESDVDAVLNQVFRFRVDGVIAAARLSDEQVRALSDRGVPLVLYNRAGKSEPVASVCCDSAAGERLLVDRLVAAGHQRFGVMAGPADSAVGEERATAAIERLRAHGLDTALCRGDFDYASGAAGLQKLMAETNGTLDALICVNDMMAIGAMDAARWLFGREPGKDLSIVGFDGVNAATWLGYRLTTVRQPVRRMTQAAVEMLMERVNDPDIPAERRQFTGELLEGASARFEPI